MRCQRSDGGLEAGVVAAVGAVVEAAVGELTCCSFPALLGFGGKDGVSFPFYTWRCRSTSYYLCQEGRWVGSRAGGACGASPGKLLTNPHIHLWYFWDASNAAWGLASPRLMA